MHHFLCNSVMKKILIVDFYRFINLKNTLSDTIRVVFQVINKEMKEVFVEKK